MRMFAEFSWSEVSEWSKIVNSLNILLFSNLRFLLKRMQHKVIFIMLRLKSWRYKVSFIFLCIGIISFVFLKCWDWVNFCIIVIVGFILHYPAIFISCVINPPVLPSCVVLLLLGYILGSRILVLFRFINIYFLSFSVLL